jgi:NAD(P)-dependent dehydrogenase (short-subunit alcohol dehydrogenase family)
MGVLDGRVAVITGAGSGIGRATALRLAQEGANIAVADLVSAAGQETAAMIKEQGGEGQFVETDVTNRDHVARLVDTVLAVYGQIDILHNNVGVGGAKAAHETTEENWDRILNGCLKSVYLCSRAVVPLMLENGGGTIVNTASVLGLVASPKQAAYCAAKGAVVLLTKQMAVDYSARGIRVNCVCPSDIETPTHQRFFATRENPEAVRRSLLDRHRIDRFGKPEEVAEAVLWLVSDASSFVTGVALPVDGGLTAW